MNKEHFKGVIWPRQNVDTPCDIYRYVIIGMLVTDVPLDLPNDQIILDGYGAGMGEVIEAIKQSNQTIRFSDATNVLLRLKEIDSVPKSGHDLVN